MSKTQRTDKEIVQAATILVIGVDSGSIGLVEAILAMPEPTGNPEIYDYDPEYKRQTNDH